MRVNANRGSGYSAAVEPEGSEFVISEFEAEMDYLRWATRYLHE
jgi:hypothetical protein